jgi:hypothetical protein
VGLERSGHKVTQEMSGLRVLGKLAQMAFKEILEILEILVGSGHREIQETRV